VGQETVKDKNGVIQRVGLDNGEMHQVGNIIYWIDNRIHEFFSTMPSERFNTPVYASHPSIGNPFITTSEDGRPPNNDLLPSCYQHDNDIICIQIQFIIYTIFWLSLTTLQINNFTSKPHRYSG
jgi:hypothetical protein